MIRKIFLCPYFGPLPTWWNAYLDNAACMLLPHGYQLLIDQDLERFKRRCFDRLGVTCRIQPGTGKIHDYRAVLAIIYRDEIKGFDYWGHTDFDIVYGNPTHFRDDDILHGCDLWTDGWDYVNGPWTLYRNSPDVNTMYASHDGWREILEEKDTLGWVEQSYSDHVKRLLGDRFQLTYLQTRNLNDFGSLRLTEDGLYEGDSEVLLAHFRRTKTYPAHLL